MSYMDLEYGELPELHGVQPFPKLRSEFDFLDEHGATFWKMYMNNVYRAKVDFLIDQLDEFVRSLLAGELGNRVDEERETMLLDFMANILDLPLDVCSVIISFDNRIERGLFWDKSDDESQRETDKIVNE